MSLPLIQQCTTDKVQYVQYAPQLIDSIKAGDMQVITALLEYAEGCLKDEQEMVLKKFLLIRLLKDCVVTKCGKLINGLANSKGMMALMEKTCLFDCGNPDPNRGKTMFKNQDTAVSAQFLRLCLELVYYLGLTFPADAKKNPTKFKALLTNLQSKNVIFPEQSELMQPLKKNVADSQVNTQQRDQVMSKLNETRKSIMDDIDMIHDTLMEGSGELDYVLDVLDTFSKSLQATSKEFKTLIQKIKAFPNTLEDREMTQLNSLLDFADKYPQLHTQFITAKQTTQAFEVLKAKVFKLIESVNSETPDSLELVQQKVSNATSNGTSNGTQQVIQQSQKPQQPQQNQQQEQKQQVQLQQQQPKSSQSYFQDQPESSQSQFQKQEIVQQQPQKPPQQQQVQQQQSPPTNKQSFQQIPQSQPTPQPIQYDDDDMNVSPKQQKFTTPQLEKLEVKQQPPQIHHEYDINSFGQRAQPTFAFEENFDTMSQASVMSSQSFPNRMELPVKVHTGREVPPKEEGWLLKLPQRDARLWKVVNVRRKGVLLENSDIQIGVVVDLQYDLLNQKSFILVNLFFGNKTNMDFSNLSIKYIGDNERLSMWIKPDDVESSLLQGEQAKQSLALQFKSASYAPPRGLISWTADERSYRGEFLVPCSLLLFTDFRDVDERIFRPKWRSKKQSIIRSPVFTLNTRVVKSGADVLKQFPRLIELIEYKRFLDQTIDGKKPLRERKYLSYKLGGVFELSDTTSEYMIKIIIYPNMLCCIQMISSYENVGVAENLLRTFVYLFGNE